MENKKVDAYTLEEINSIFSLAYKIYKLADDCVCWLVNDSENKKIDIKYSNKAIENFSIDKKDFPNCHRQGRHFTTDNYKTFWFLGLTVDIDREFSFSLAYRGDEEKINLKEIKQTDYKKIGDWLYFKLDKSLLCTENERQRKENLQKVVNALLEKLIGKEN
ncbi:MAG: hypothetical protein II146_08185 [Treponema sp.]|nr:hypothetical protein [Treponema sp.]